MALVVDIVPEVIFLSCKNTFLNTYVFGIGISPSQAIMALCIERSVNMVMVTVRLSWSIWSQRSFFSVVRIYAQTVMCSE